MQEWNQEHLKTEISCFIEENYSATVLPEDLRYKIRNLRVHRELHYVCM